MRDQTRIKSAMDRSVAALRARPFLGQGTAVTKVRLQEGLTCEVEEGDWKFVAGMSEKAGGDNAGPNPGILGRGSLGACLAIGYSMWAARRGVPLSGLEVEIQADYDVRGEYGVADIPPRYMQVRYLVTVESAAPEAEVMAMLDEADAHSSYHDLWRRAVDLRRQVRVVAPAEK